MLNRFFLALLLLPLPLTQVVYAQSLHGVTDNGAFEYSTSLGVIALEAKEHVFTSSGSTDNLSLLIWQSVAPVSTSSFDLRLPRNWTISGNAQLAFSGASYMEDYDWLAPYSPSFAFEDWSDRSQHANTNLDWYFNGSLAMGKDFNLDDDVTVNVNAGLKYVDVQWAAVGGNYDYSVGGFRDTSGTFADVPAITYRQQLPSVFAGIDAELLHEDWAFDFGAQAGVTFLSVATDTHWMRSPPLRFIDDIYPAPTLALSATATYEFAGNLDLFVAGTVEKVFLGRGDTTIYNNDTNANLGSVTDVAGAELTSASISTGVSGTF